MKKVETRLFQICGPPRQKQLILSRQTTSPSSVFLKNNNKYTNLLVEIANIQEIYFHIKTSKFRSKILSMKHFL